jgi:signal transduction histidine kinase
VFICLGLLLLVVAMLSYAGYYASNAYRDLVRSLRTRSGELPIAAKLSLQVSELRITLSGLDELQTYDFLGDTKRRSDYAKICRDWFTLELDNLRPTLHEYRSQLEAKTKAGSRVTDHEKEWRTVYDIDETLQNIRQIKQDPDWVLDPARVDKVQFELNRLQGLVAEFPSHLRDTFEGLPNELRGQYRTLIVGTWTIGAVAAVISLLLVKLFFNWVFKPLQVLVAGSRRVAGGDFDHRIMLDTHDEMAELAHAMNGMTARFQAISNDLERQVEERTRQVIRSEQLASVGFLAAGVAHEINNPLASVAMCAESLEGRLHDVLDQDDEQQAVVANYLKMIQTEAFRCKEITEKLLDFSRLGDVQHHATELGQLVRDVIDMLGHLGKYQGKKIQFSADPAVVASVNAQEMKQVALNLLTNALESIDTDGEVRVQLIRSGEHAELIVADNGCGMEPEVLQHLFEPFFTRRQSGQGTGLGLSITYRIIAEHHGEIEVDSPGPGQGSTFRVRLPLGSRDKEFLDRDQAA